MKLDLGTLKQETLDITMLDGEVLHIKKPSKGLLVEINKADIELAKEVDFEAIVNMMEAITVKILSNNTESIRFTLDYLEKNEIDYIMQTAIFKSYIEFVTKVASNPN